MLQTTRGRSSRCSKTGPGRNLRLPGFHLIGAPTMAHPQTKLKGKPPASVVYLIKSNDTMWFAFAFDSTGPRNHAVGPRIQDSLRIDCLNLVGKNTSCLQRMPFAHLLKGRQKAARRQYALHTAWSFGMRRLTLIACNTASVAAIAFHAPRSHLAGKGIQEVRAVL